MNKFRLAALLVGCVALEVAVAQPPSGLSYSSNPVLYGVGRAITPNIPTVTGLVTSWSVSPMLPAGLAINSNSGVISGTPTVASAAANYIVTARGAGSTTVTLNITVLTAPSGLFYSQNPVIYSVGMAITPNIPTVTGVVTSWSVVPALPAGLVFNTTTGIITGTPNVGSVAVNHTITATNVAGSATCVLNIRVLSAPLGLAYSNNPATYGVGVLITPNTPTVVGTPIGWSVNRAMPSGLSLDTMTGIISGIPTMASIYSDYIVTVQTVSGPASAVVVIRVLAAPSPSNFTYSANPAMYGLGVAISTNFPLVTGTVESYSVTPALPAGLMLSTTTGLITGTPTALSPASNYTVTALNAGGFATANLNIAVLLVVSTQNKIGGENFINLNINDGPAIQISLPPNSGRAKMEILNLNGKILWKNAINLSRTKEAVCSFVPASSEILFARIIFFGQNQASSGTMIRKIPSPR